MLADECRRHVLVDIGSAVGADDIDAGAEAAFDFDLMADQIMSMSMILYVVNSPPVSLLRRLHAAALSRSATESPAQVS